jgi:hypothetical protein
MVVEAMKVVLERRIGRISRNRRKEQTLQILQSCKRTREVDDNEKRMDDIKR